jgi:secreted trypsin-like serine protease
MNENFFPAENITIIAGSTHRQSSRRLELASLLYLVHPQFQTSRALPMAHDLAMIKLARPINLSSSTVGIACLPKTNMPLLKDGDLAFTGGWGKTSTSNKSVQQARKAPLRITTSNTCRSRGSLTNLHEALHICAISTEGRNICEGDSGSGLWIKEADGLKWFVAGIASFGKAECSTAVNKDNAFTSVAIHSDWIRTVIDKH